jgi:hypothetical protein
MFQPTLFSSDILENPQPLPPPPRMPRSDIRELRPRRPRAAAPRRSRTNWQSRSTAATLDLQDRLVAALAAAGSGFTVRELGEELGVSRQHALYHMKKAVAAGRVTMLLEPCERNGGLQFRCWHPLQLARRFARTLPMSERVDIFMRTHNAA